MKQIMRIQKNETRIHDASCDGWYHVEAGACLTLFDIAIHPETPMHAIHVALLGEEASVELYGVFFGTGSDTYSLEQSVVHCAPRTHSKIIVYGTLDGEATSRCRSMIRMEKGVHVARGQEEIRVILLSNRAMIDAVPDLEIETDDVSCSHAVTVSALDEQKKWYLETRGLDEETAKREMVRGHVSFILDRIPDEEIRSRAGQMIEARI